MEISMVKVNVVMACKILKSLQVVVHAKLIIQRGFCKEIKIPKKKNVRKLIISTKSGLEDDALPLHHC